MRAAKQEMERVEFAGNYSFIDDEMNESSCIEHFNTLKEYSVIPYDEVMEALKEIIKTGNILEKEKVFELIDRSPLERGTGAVLCMADQLGAFDQNNLIVPISLI